MSTVEVTLPKWAPSTRRVADALTASVLVRGGARTDALRDAGDFGDDTWPSRQQATSALQGATAEVRAAIGKLTIPAERPDPAQLPQMAALWDAMQDAAVYGATGPLQLILMAEAGGRPDSTLYDAFTKTYERKLKTLGILAAYAFDEGGPDGDPGTDDGDTGGGSGVRYVDVRGPLLSQTVDGPPYDLGASGTRARWGCLR